MKVKVCECCGHPLPDTSVEAALSPFQRRIFQIVQRSGTAGIGTASIADMLYAQRADGGPEHAKCVIATTVKKINAKLRIHGFIIRGRTGPGGGYTLNVV